MPIFFKNNKGLDSGSNNTKVIQSSDITSTGIFKSKVNIDGLILNYDAADFDSFPPKTSTTNIITDAIHMNGWADYGYGNDGKFTTEFNTTGYRMINRGSWNGLYKSFTLPSTGTYTFSAWYRWWASGSGNNGATSYQNGFVSDTAAGIDTSVSKVGVWQRVSNTINATSTSGTFYLISYGGTYGGSNSTWDVTMPMIEAGTSATPWVNGTNGTAVIDTSNYGNNAIANSATGWATTKQGAWTFNGSSSAIDLNSPLPEISGNNPFTIEIWYQRNNNTYGVLFGNYGSGYTNGIWMFTGGIYIQGSCYESGWNSGAYDGTPMHIVCTRDTNGITRVYRGGFLTQTALLTGYVPNNINYRIGNDVNVNGEAFSGNIHIVRVYNRVLNPYEIAENYNAVKERFATPV